MSGKITQIEKKLAEHEERISKLEELFAEKTVSLEKALSIKEFMIQKQPKNDVQRTLVIGFYLENYTKLSSFSCRDITDGFREAKEPVPKNVSDKIQMNIAKGHMMETPRGNKGPRTYVLTNTGESFVRNNFREQ